MSFTFIIFIVAIGLIALAIFCTCKNEGGNELREGFAPNIADADISAIRNLNGLANELMKPNGTLTNPGNLTIQGQTRITNSKNDPQLVITSLNENSVGNTNPTVFMEAFNGPNNVKRDISIAAWGGNVGIGLINPGTKLDVLGNIKASGNINATSDINVDGNAAIKGKLTAANIGFTDRGGQEGKYILPGGFMFQFGKASAGSTGYTNITFPQAFSRVMGIQLTAASNPGGNGVIYITNNPTAGNNGVGLTNTSVTFDSAYGIGQKPTIFWFAYGLE